jgi:hypothetical protein
VRVLLISSNLEKLPDSGPPVVLARLGKDLTPEDIQRVSLLVREAGVGVCHSLVGRARFLLADSLAAGERR